jgi:hypothetical protein
MTPGPSPNVVLIGTHADLAARPFEATWGRVDIIQSAAPEGEQSAEIAVILEPGLDQAGVNATTWAVWHPDATSVEDGLVLPRPWPVADDLFEMPPSPHDGACLVLAPGGADVDPVVERLEERGLHARVAVGATRRLLAEARIVMSLTRALPAETFAVLAAGRLLVGPATDRTCGLQAWIDYVPFAHEDELVQIVDTLAAYPDSWGPIRALGRQSAEAHRASRAIGRLIRRVS